MKKLINLLLIFSAFIQITLEPAFSYQALSDDIPADYIYKLKAEKHTYVPAFIKDDTAPTGAGFKKLEYKPKHYKDYAIHLTEEDKYFKKPVYTGQIDLTEGIPVYLTPITTVKTNLGYKNIAGGAVLVEYPLVGTPIRFINTQNVVKDGKIVLPKGAIVTGIVGHVIIQESGGDEGQIIVERLHSFDINNNYLPLSGTINSKGANTGYFFGAGYLLAPFTMGLSYFLGAIPGTSGKIVKGKIYTVYYK